MITVKPVKASALLPDYTRVAASIRHGWLRREQLWFDVPQTSSDAINRSGDCWLTALLPLAFERGETLRIHAPVDPVLLQNAERLQRVWAGWFPPRKPVRVEAEPVTASPAAGEKTGLFFTGGVDSFFSLLHFDETTPVKQKIDDLIFVWGFDIPLANRAAFERKLDSLQKIAARLGKNMIPLVTNLRRTRLRKLDWGSRLHGSALGAAGLLLGARFKKLLLSSSQSPDDLNPWGSHRFTTPLMSSSATQWVDYGSDCYRFEKTEFIAGSPIALEHLHVCWVEGSEKNCGRCEKCYRTLLALEVIGQRARATSFPQDDFSLEYVKNLNLDGGLRFALFAEIKKGAQKRSRPDVVAAIEACLAANPRPG